MNMISINICKIQYDTNHNIYKTYSVLAWIAFKALLDKVLQIVGQHRFVQHDHVHLHNVDHSLIESEQFALLWLFFTVSQYF